MRTVFITGTDRGLGPCLVQAFIDGGWRVFSGRRSMARSESAPRDVSPRLTELAIDIGHLGSVQAAASVVTERSAGLDVLINNAAINPRPEADLPLEQVDFDVILHTLDVNAVGALRVSQCFLPLLERGGSKLIANISSEAGSLARACRDTSYGYCMSKAALNMQSRILDKALAPRGFNVLSIHPGWMRTPMGGPNAALDPAESARGIHALLADFKPGTPRFVQQDGSAFPW